MLEAKLVTADGTGAPVVSAALSVAEDRNLNGLDFLRAVIAGYEVSTRIAVVMGRAHYKYWHNTATVGSDDRRRRSIVDGGRRALNIALYRTLKLRCDPTAQSVPHACVFVGWFIN